MANTVYDNFILENKLESLISTNVDVNNYMTVDNSLTATAGMKKTIHTYSATGAVEDLAEGQGNTDANDITVSFTSKDYDVATTQARFKYTDEQGMKDSVVIDGGLKAISENMTNDLTAKAIAEFGKATLGVTYAKGSSIDFDTVVDAVAKLNTEDESGLFMLINPAMKAALRKTLKDDLKYSETYVRTGYIGTVAGVPVIVSKAVPNGTAYIATKEAVTCFVKKGSEIEQDRDINTRINMVYGRKVMVVALTDARKVVKVTEAIA
jgi:hypothetical protein